MALLSFRQMRATLCSVLLLMSSVNTMKIPEPQCSKYAFEERILEKLVRMEHQVQLMDEKLQRFEPRFDQVLGDIKEQQKQLEDTKQSITSEVEDVLSTIQGNAKATLTEVQSRVDKQDDTIRAFVENVTTTLQEQKVVMFSAKDVVSTNPSSGSLIRFKTAVTNVGDAYNADTGRFTAPTDGVYTFTVQLCINSAKNMNVQVMAADNVVNSILIYGYYGDVHCSSVNTIVELNTGDQVWVKMVSGSPSPIYQDSISWNSFSGVLNHRTG